MSKEISRVEWNRGSQDIQLKNGQIIKKYFIEFKTTDFETMIFLEKIFANVMGLTADEILGEQDE